MKSDTVLAVAPRTKREVTATPRLYFCKYVALPPFLRVPSIPVVTFLVLLLGEVDAVPVAGRIVAVQESRGDLVPALVLLEQTAPLAELQRLPDVQHDVLHEDRHVRGQDERLHLPRDPAHGGAAGLAQVRDRLDDVREQPGFFAAALAAASTRTVHLGPPSLLKP